MAKKQYTATTDYEKKLKKVMQRFGVEEFDFDYSRKLAFVEFFYKGQAYRFEQSIENAKKHGVNLCYGSDCFAQIVLSLEDLARMNERGIYDLSTWLTGLKQLPSAPAIPNEFLILQFNTIPTMEELKTRYHKLAKATHPDTGGNSEQFNIINEAYKKCCEYLEV